MKHVFITGVSSGIGYDAMKTLLDQGYRVTGTVRTETDAKRLRTAFQSNARILVMDVAQPDSCEQAMAEIIPDLEAEGLYSLINNAGIAVPGPLQYLPEEDFAYQMEVNVLAVRRITNRLLPYLGTTPGYSPGKIIMISSVSGLFNAPFNGAYCISKHALESMTDIYRRELSIFGIRVAAIEPGPVKTQIWKKNLGALDAYKDTPYAEILASADKMILNAEKSGFDVSVITSCILQILNTDKPRTRYLIHRKKTLFRVLSGWLPDEWVDKLIQKTLSKKDQYRPI
jgi:NAD(P)-dependent dehydrogenase (short-subunit alcohol dehydrogenase family)